MGCLLGPCSPPPPPQAQPALSQPLLLLMGGRVSRLSLPPPTATTSMQKPEKAFQNTNQILPFPVHNPPRVPRWREDNTPSSRWPSQDGALPGSSYRSSHKVGSRLTMAATLAFQLPSSSSLVLPWGPYTQVSPVLSTGSSKALSSEPRTLLPQSQ